MEEPLIQKSRFGEWGRDKEFSWRRWAGICSVLGTCEASMSRRQLDVESEAQEGELGASGLTVQPIRVKK